MGREEKQSYCVPPVGGGDLDGRRSRFKDWVPLGPHPRGECRRFASRLFPEKRRTTFSLSCDEWNGSRAMVKVGEAGTRTRLVEAITCKWSGAMRSVYERQHARTTTPDVCDEPL